MSNHTRSTTITTTTLAPPVSPVWPNKSVDYDRALSLLADDLLALARGDVRRPAEPVPAPVSLGVGGAVGVEKENAP